MRKPDKNQKWHCVFLSWRCRKHSLWEPSAMMRNTAVTPLWERWNLIRSERLHKHSFVLISLVKAAQGLSVDRPLSNPASDLSAVLGLSWLPPVWCKGIRSPQLRGVCSHCEVGSEAQSFWGLCSPCVYVTLKIYGSPTAVKTSVLWN